jgi:hypothetical protein
VARTPNYIKPRQIDDEDVPEVIMLLTRGFEPARSRQFWMNVFGCLSRRPVPPGFPRYGYVLESDGRVVGAIVLIFSTVRENGETKIRGNSSSWYVEPEFRLYAQLLISHALKSNNVTILNISAARHTQLMVESSGFKQYSRGVFFAIPVLSKPPIGNSVRIFGAHVRPDVPFDSSDRDLLLEHMDYGCTSLWCIANERAYPFVFRPRKVKFLVPCAQLVYCKNIDSFVQFARPIGLYLARRLQLLVLLDSNTPIPGLVGRYKFGRMPRYFFGLDSPRLGDLAYTETSMFGV